MAVDKKRLNILQINTVDNVGGAAKVAYRLKEGLNKKGHKSWMMVGNKGSDKRDVKQIPRFSILSR